MDRESSKFPRYLVQTVRQFSGSVFIPNINLQFFEQQFAGEVQKTPLNRVKELETAFSNFSLYLCSTKDPIERDYYLRHLGVLAARICALNEVDFVTAHQTDVTFEKNGVQIVETNKALVGSSLRL